ncbi:hypothetical protein FE784_22945 [Paenibacillus hemerocallicola]|uniref:Uncharacterized protein n=1 Tax=Paenibacillus hemerocallicola TaxID=1172614 RepID=A0A5C4T6N1_9BACL|nr:hypothetical protein [Paenibacillus hemerocallicola]TNJ63889.1 hypothetical protein FE784_22945 [Paenibacillus hemerocallicola]
MARLAFMHSHTFILTDVRPFGECSRESGTAGAAEQTAADAANEDYRCAIALFADGPGIIDLDGISVSLRQGTCLQLRPGGRFGMPVQPGLPTGWLVEFLICRLGEARPLAGGFPLLPYHQEIAGRPLAALCSVTEQRTRATS